MSAANERRAIYARSRRAIVNENGSKRKREESKTSAAILTVDSVEFEASDSITAPTGGGGTHGDIGAGNNECWDESYGEKNIEDEGTADTGSFKQDDNSVCAEEEEGSDDGEIEFGENTNCKVDRLIDSFIISNLVDEAEDVDYFIDDDDSLVRDNPSLEKGHELNKEEFDEQMQHFHIMEDYINPLTACENPLPHDNDMLLYQVPGIQPAGSTKGMLARDLQVIFDNFTIPKKARNRMLEVLHEHAGDVLRCCPQQCPQCCYYLLHHHLPQCPQFCYYHFHHHLPQQL